MSLKPQPIQPVPELTVEIAQASFPKGNPYLKFRNELGTIFTDEDFSDLYPIKGQPATTPWRLALITILQYRENLSDRATADAVRARMDWKYLLGLELTDPGFDFSILSEFRGRLISGSAEERLLDQLLARFVELKLLKSRGRQRTDATYVLAAVHERKRLALIAETLRAALNEIAVVAPDWLQPRVPQDWYKRYGRWLVDGDVPDTEEKRKTYAQQVGEDGFTLLDWLDEAGAPAELPSLPQVDVLRTVWQRHYIREEESGPPSGRCVRLKKKEELGGSEDAIESPYDTEARYRRRDEKTWTGYVVHWSESCDEDLPHLITHVKTTRATVHEACCTESIHQGLADKELLPDQHLVDSAYIDAELLVSSRKNHHVTLIGPTRSNTTWQKREGGYDASQFTLDWERQQAQCPLGKISTYWRDSTTSRGEPGVTIRFAKSDCLNCKARTRCTRAKNTGREIWAHPRERYEALQQARQFIVSEEGKELFKQRAGIEGTLSQGVRGFGLRKIRYWGLAKTHLQHVATAAAINLDRIINWLDGKPLETTRTSRFAALAIGAG